MATNNVGNNDEETNLTKHIFGGSIACILLGLYVYLVCYGVSLVRCEPQPACLAGFTKPMGSALALIGGLVSALVIAELAITKPNEDVLNRVLPRNENGKAINIQHKNILRLITWGYLAIWILAGLAAFVTGLLYPDVLQPLHDLGQTWLGLAVAAAYAYFGINPS